MRTTLDVVGVPGCKATIEVVITPDKLKFPANRQLLQGERPCRVCGSGKADHWDRSHAYEPERLMSLRDAVMAWVGLPKLSKLSVVTLSPGDVIVAECECNISEATQEYLKQKLESVWPGTKIVVCDLHLKLKVVRQVEAVDAERASGGPNL